jgi:hypothetical protein
MIRHLVLFNLKAEIELSDREWLFVQILGLSKIPSVRRLADGKLLDPREDWYKPRMATDFGWALTMEFENEDELYMYQQDPSHVTVAQEIRKRVTNIKVMDFVSLAHQ